MKKFPVPTVESVDVIVKNNEAAGDVASPKRISAPNSDTTKTDTLLLLSISVIQPNPNQPRTYMDEDSLNDLSNSIAEHGVLQPIIVHPAQEGIYLIIAGERRWRASKMAGLKELPVIVKDLEPGRSFEVALIENVQRENLNPVEEAMAFQKLKEDFGNTHDEISRKVGKSRSAVTNSIRLLSLPGKIRGDLESGVVNTGQVRPLLGLDEVKALKLYKKIQTETLSVREIEAYAAGNKKKTNKASAKKSKNELFSSSAATLMRRLGRKVRFEGTESKGWVCLEYYSKDDLMTLSDFLSQEASKYN